MVAANGKKTLYFSHIKEVKRLLLLHPYGITDLEISLLLRVNRTTAYRLRVELGAYEVIPGGGRYTLSAQPDDVELARAILWRDGWQQDETV